MRSAERTWRRPRGVTLLELLIVMVIMLMVTAAAIPMIAPAMRNRQMREATRLVSAYFGAARARSVQTGRPVGIQINRFNGNAFALQLSQVEVPVPYAGDISGSKATVAITNPGTTAGETPLTTETKTYFDQKFNLSVAGNTMSAIWFRAAIPLSEFNHRLVRVGDRIQFGNQGYAYTIYGPDKSPQDGVIDSPSGTNVLLDIAYQYPASVAYVRANAATTPMIAGIRFPWENAPPLPVPQAPTYQVFRQPARSTAQPLTLPEGIVVDLSASIINSRLFSATNYEAYTPGGNAPAPVVNFDPVIVFSPSGRLESVIDRTGQLVRPTSPVNLLMGRRELMFDVTAKGDPADLVFQNLSAAPPASATTTLMPPAENFWMTIGYQTGQVSVSQVSPHYQDYKGQTSGITFTTQQDIINFALNGGKTPPPPPIVEYPGALSFAKESQSLGGR